MKNKFHKEIWDWEHFVYISPFLAFSPPSSFSLFFLCVLSRHFFSALLPLHTRCTIWGHITHQKAARLCFIRASKKLLCCVKLKEGAEGRSDMVITFVHRENNVLAMRDEKKSDFHFSLWDGCAADAIRWEIGAEQTIKLLLLDHGNGMKSRECSTKWRQNEKLFLVNSHLNSFLGTQYSIFISSLNISYSIPLGLTQTENRIG